MHYSEATIQAKVGLASQKPKGSPAITLDLRGEDTAWNPDDKLRLIQGPVRVHYFKRPGGAWIVTQAEPGQVKR